MTAECADPSDQRVDQFRAMKFSDLDSIARDLLTLVETGIRVVEKIEECSEIKTKMLRVGVSNATSILKDVLTAYEERQAEVIKKK